MLRNRSHLVVPAILGLALATLLGGRARADYINFTYSTTLQGNAYDPAGLDGAQIAIDAQFNTGKTYVADGAGNPIVLDDLATLTISGSSVASNNTTYILPQLGFVPTFSDGLEAGLETIPRRETPTVTLGDDHLFNLSVFTDATSHGRNVQIGDKVNNLDFGTVGPVSLYFAVDLTEGVYYTQREITTSATLVSEAVPEPASIVLCGFAAAFGIFAFRLLRQPDRHQAL